MILNLKKLRIERHISQQQLAGVIGVSQQSINKYENHSVEPDVNTLCALADFFDVSIDYLIGRDFRPVVLSDERPLSPHEWKLIEQYRLLDLKGRACVDTLLQTYLENQ